MRQYNSGEELLSEIKEKWNKNLKATRIWGFIASIMMLIMGVLSIIYPVATTYAIEVMISIALLVFGFWEIVRYIQMPAFIRTGAGLASGILNVLLGVTLLTSPAESMMASFGFLFGFDLMMLGIEQVTMTGRLHSIRVRNTGWLTFEGVMNIIVGFVLLMMPLASVAAVSVAITIYLFFGGINLLVTCINAKDLKAE